MRKNFNPPCPECKAPLLKNGIRDGVQTYKCLTCNDARRIRTKELIKQGGKPERKTYKSKGSQYPKSANNPKCPHCDLHTRKAGVGRDGQQRYRCMGCRVSVWGDSLGVYNG